MEPKDLVKVWDAPDNSKLTPKQISIRLPILVSAKISALCDIYPRKTKTELIGDLLSTALDQVESAIPYYDGAFLFEHPVEGPIFEEEGPRRQYRDLVEKYLRELEAEAGIKEPIQWGISAHVSKQS